MISERIESCFDSHVHWAATGEFSERLLLTSLGSVKEILQLPKDNLVLRDGWVLGFGWDQTNWPDADQIHLHILDQWMSDKPVLFTRIDGHVGWVNSAALKAAGWLNDRGELRIDVPKGGRIETDAAGKPTGLLVDKAYELFLHKVPKVRPNELRRHLLKSMQIFHAEGFTHIRDVGASLDQWTQAMMLDRAQVLNLAVEMFFHVENLNDLDKHLIFIEGARRVATPNLRPRGVKIFLDGALGSEGAWVSEGYRSGSGHGLQILNEQEIEHVFRATWEKNLEVAIHVIGDAAVHQAVSIAQRLKVEGVTGRLHLEHVEIARPETIELMKSLDVVCHLQPCHWLSDQRWLKEKVGDKLYSFSFPWRELQKAEVAFDFGSDTPIEPPSVLRTLQALQESSQKGIAKLLGNPERHMSHSDRAFASNSYSIFREGRPTEVVFRGQHLQ
jgi:predicted amidohydrolase YtcJ